MLSRFDHLTVAVLDVPRAVARYTALLGAPPSWQGEHRELGTQAALFGVGNALIELVGPKPGAPEADGLREWLAAHGEGLQALAFGVDDAAAARAQLLERGLRAAPPEHGEARGADGSVRRYASVQLSPKHTRGLSVLLVERSDAPQLMAAVSDPAAAEALDHVVIRSADLDAAVSFYRDALGIRLALDTDRNGVRMLFFRMGRVTIEVVHDAAAISGDVLYGAAYRVRDIAGARARLRAAGSSVSDVRSGRKPGTHVFDLREPCCGVPTLVIRDPSRG
jgi:catechol 2,3-dioxygenase-like lactoylglutathione lyase family enzyme